MYWKEVEKLHTDTWKHFPKTVAFLQQNGFEWQSIPDCFYEVPIYYSWDKVEEIGTMIYFYDTEEGKPFELILEKEDGSGVIDCTEAVSDEVCLETVQRWLAQ